MPKERNFVSAIESSSEVDYFMERKDDDTLRNSKSQNTHLTFNVSRKYKLKIQKELFLLKISLFVWATGTSTCSTYFPLLLKSRGITIEELSASVAASAVLQFLVPFLSGLIADRIGTAKPILIFYISVCTLVATVLIFLPPIPHCSEIKVVLDCNSSNALSSETFPLYDFTRNSSSDHFYVVEHHMCTYSKDVDDYSNNTRIRICIPQAIKTNKNMSQSNCNKLSLENVVCEGGIHACEYWNDIDDNSNNNRIRICIPEELRANKNMSQLNCSELSLSDVVCDGGTLTCEYLNDIDDYSNNTRIRICIPEEIKTNKSMSQSNYNKLSLDNVVCEGGTHVCEYLNDVDDYSNNNRIRICIPEEIRTNKNISKSNCNKLSLTEVVCEGRTRMCTYSKDVDDYSNVYFRICIPQAIRWNKNMPQLNCSKLPLADVVCEGGTYRCEHSKNIDDLSNNISFRICFHRSIGTNTNTSCLKCDKLTNSTCMFSCDIESDTCEHSAADKRMWTWCYFILIPLLYCFRSTVVGFSDVTTVKLTQEHKASYGTQQVWDVLGYITGNFLSGYAITDEQGADYNIILYFFIISCILTGFLFWKIDVRPVQPNKQMIKTSKILIRNPDLLAFVAVLVIAGMSYGVESTYFSWYMETIGSSLQMIGLVAMCGSIYGLPFLFASRQITGKLKEHNIFVLALLSHGSYCMSYSYMLLPWTAFMVEILYPVALDLFWVAVVQYCQLVSPPGMISTVIATASTIHFNLGIVLSGLFGGMLVHRYSLQMAYRAMGFLAFGTAALYSTFLFSMHQYRKRRNISVRTSGIQEMISVEDT